MASLSAPCDSHITATSALEGDGTIHGSSVDLLIGGTSRLISVGAAATRDCRNSSSLQTGLGLRLGELLSADCGCRSEEDDGGQL